MGTSVNQRSPDTPSWKIVQRAYEDPTITPERNLQEIWRAATNQQGNDLGRQLSGDIVRDLAQVAVTAGSAAEAGQIATHLIADSKGASLGADLARRAAMQAAGREFAGDFFLQRLFAEATAYLVSRDLPGHISEGKRLPTVSAAREYRQQLTLMAASVAQAAPRVDLGAVTSRGWSDYVANVLTLLKESPGRSIL